MLYYRGKNGPFYCLSVICSCFFFSFEINLHLVFFQSSKKYFYFQILHFIIFLHKDIFSLTTTHDTPFLQIHTTIYFLLVYLLHVLTCVVPRVRGLHYLVTLLMSVNDE